MSTMDYETDQRPYDDDAPSYRDRSRSPRGDRDNGADIRTRSASPIDRDRDRDRDRLDSRPPASAVPNLEDDDETARNEGSNLFVTGFHPRLDEAELSALFEKYGEVENCNIMRDPHSKESRGFGFVKMVHSDAADKAKEGLAGEVIEGRTMSIEKARRSKPRTPTPGKYFGPPKRGIYPFHSARGRPRGGASRRPPSEFYVVGKDADIYWGEDFRPRGGGGRFGGGDRYGRGDDRGYGSRRDDYRGSRYGSRYGDRHDDRYEDRHRYDDRYRYDDRGGYGSRRDRDDGYSRGGGSGGGGGGDRYGSDRYAREDRRGGGGGYGGYERDDPARGSGGYESRDPYAGGAAGSGAGRSYDDRPDDRYSTSRR